MSRKLSNFLSRRAGLVARRAGSLQAKKALSVLALAAAAVMLADPAHAGTDGAEFADVWTTLTGWMQGTLGKIVAGAFVIVGLVAGVARQSIMAFAIGVGGAIGLYNAPTILDNIVTGTVPLLPEATAKALPAVNLLTAVSGL
ncbi:TraA family conjugative transfer protein [Pseudoroseomonas sp. WGS1072]|uniref:TraA family conjugative transfer protein n=1 Tax=Roseomonas sp. WGS1072 TaxID=3366816 RepID=UPI003BF33ACF